MKRFAIILSVFLAACVTTPKGSFTTVADSTVQRDIRKNIGLCEFAKGGDSSPTIISADFMNKDGESYKEEWVVDRNGENITYDVSLKQVNTGGVNIAIICNK